MNRLSRVALVGAGSSAQRYLTSFLGEQQLAGVFDSQGKGQLGEHPVRPLDELKLADCDRVVIASWAIDELLQTLSRLDVPESRIDLFLNDRDEVIDVSTWRARKQGEAQRFDRQSGGELLAVYDLNVARPTYDILAFLCLAELERMERSLSYVHLVIVPPSLNDFNAQLLPVIPPEEQSWRTHQILIDSAQLLPSCRGVSLLPSRETLTSLIEGRAVWPEGSCVDRPKACWEFNHLVDVVARGGEIRQLRSSQQAKTILNSWVREVNPQNLPMVSITLRNCALQKARNSDLAQWRKFVASLDRSEYFPVIVPDTERGLEPSPIAEATLFPVAAFNLDMRMALYEASFLNLGVANGPAHLWVFSKACRYLMFKQIVDTYNHSSEASFRRRQIEPGQDFPGAGPGQHLVWEDDRLSVIQREFARFIKALSLAEAGS